eukprot:UN08123
MSRLICYKTVGLYSQGNAFEQKIIMGTFLALILNFSTVGHGGPRKFFAIFQCDLRFGTKNISGEISRHLMSLIKTPLSKIKIDP